MFEDTHAMHEYPIVKARFERDSDGVPGPFYVMKDRCIICGLPPQTAPLNITWDAQF